MNKRPRVEVLKATPCIEGLFLAILQHSGFSQASATSASCKRDFHADYISEYKKMDKRSYATKFSKTIIDRPERPSARVRSYFKGDAGIVGNKRP